MHFYSKTVFLLKIIYNVALQLVVAYSIMVIIVGSEFGYPSPKPGQGCLYFT